MPGHVIHNPISMIAVLRSLRLFLSHSNSLSLSLVWHRLCAIYDQVFGERHVCCWHKFSLSLLIGIWCVCSIDVWLMRCCDVSAARSLSNHFAFFGEKIHFIRGRNKQTSWISTEFFHYATSVRPHKRRVCKWRSHWTKWALIADSNSKQQRTHNWMKWNGDSEWWQRPNTNTLSPITCGWPLRFCFCFVFFWTDKWNLFISGRSCHERRKFTLLSSLDMCANVQQQRKRESSDCSIGWNGNHAISILMIVDWFAVNDDKQLLGDLRKTVNCCANHLATPSIVFIEYDLIRESVSMMRDKRQIRTTSANPIVILIDRADIVDRCVYSYCVYGNHSRIIDSSRKLKAKKNLNRFA